MDKRKLGRSDLSIEPVIFGCNVLGWTLEESEAETEAHGRLRGRGLAAAPASLYGARASKVARAHSGVRGFQSPSRKTRRMSSSTSRSITSVAPAARSTAATGAMRVS